MSVEDVCAGPPRHRFASGADGSVFVAFVDRRRWTCRRGSMTLGGRSCGLHSTRHWI